MTQCSRGEEYRIIDYGGRWFLERLRSIGVWEILGEFKSKKQAERALEKIGGLKHGDQ